MAWREGAKLIEITISLRYRHLRKKEQEMYQERERERKREGERGVRDLFSVLFANQCKLQHYAIGQSFLKSVRKRLFSDT